MYGYGIFAGLAIASFIWLSGCGASKPLPVSVTEDLTMKKAKEIHERIVTLDTHVDFTPANFTDQRNYTQRLDTQLNLPKMFEGGLDAVFFSIFVSQTREAQNPDAFMPAGYERAYKAAIEKFDAVHRLVERFAPDKIALASTAADVKRIHAAGKKIALIGVENGYPLSEDIGRVKEFCATDGNGMDYRRSDDRLSSR